MNFVDRTVRIASRALLSFPIVAVIVSPLASSGDATHQVDHRYLVLGYARDRAGQPVPREAQERQEIFELTLSEYLKR